MIDLWILNNRGENGKHCPVKRWIQLLNRKFSQQTGKLQSPHCLIWVVIHHLLPESNPAADGLGVSLFEGLLVESLLLAAEDAMPPMKEKQRKLPLGSHPPIYSLLKRSLQWKTRKKDKVTDLKDMREQSLATQCDTQLQQCICVAGAKLPAELDYFF